MLHELHGNNRDVYRKIYYTLRYNNLIMHKNDYYRRIESCPASPFLKNKLFYCRIPRKLYSIKMSKNVAAGVD